MKEMAGLVRQGELNVEKDGRPVPDGSALDAVLAEAIEQQLGVMGKGALLEA